MLRKFTILFCLTSLFLLIAETTVRCSKHLSEKMSAAVFSFNKNTERVTAEVLGYSFRLHQQRRGATRVSYFYAVAYEYQNEKYFAEVEAARSIGGDEHPHLPLPEKIDVLIDSDQPQEIIYPQTYHPLSFGFWLIRFFLVGFTVLALFSIKNISFRQQIEVWKNSKGFKKKYQFIFARLFLLCPLIFSAYNISDYGNSANAASLKNYRMLLLTNSADNQNKTSSGTADFIQGQTPAIFRFNTWLVFIQNFPDTKLINCYAVNDRGVKFDLNYKFNGNQLYVEKADDESSLKYLILQTENETYFLPLRGIYRDE